MDGLPHRGLFGFSDSQMYTTEFTTGLIFFKRGIHADIPEKHSFHELWIWARGLRLARLENAKPIKPTRHITKPTSYAVCTLKMGRFGASTNLYCSINLNSVPSPIFHKFLFWLPWENWIYSKYVFGAKLICTYFTISPFLLESHRKW